MTEVDMQNKSCSSDEGLDVPEEFGDVPTTVKAQRKALRKQMRRDAKTAESGGGGGCCGNKPQLSEKDQERLEEAKRQYRDDKAAADEIAAAERAAQGPVKLFVRSLSRWIFLLSLGVGFIYMKAGSETFVRMREVGDRLETNPYVALGISQKASTKEVKKAYRDLARTYHPDLNPECGEACEVALASIKEAFDILSDPTAKHAYDTAGVSIGKTRLNSRASVDITTRTVNEYLWEILSSTGPKTPVVLQVYDPSDERCQSFHEVWESISEQLRLLKIPALRVDITQQRSLMRALPLKPQGYPAVLAFVPGHSTRLMPLRSASNPKDAVNWLSDSILGKAAEIEVFDKREGLDAVTAWWREKCEMPTRVQDLAGDQGDDKALIVFYGGSSAKDSPGVMLKRLAIHFSHVADFSYLPRSESMDGVRWPIKQHEGAVVMLPPCSERLAKGNTVPLLQFARINKVTFGNLSGWTRFLLSHRALPLTRITAQTLCGSDAGTGVEVSCVMSLIDGTELSRASLDAVVPALPPSRKTFQSKLASFSADGDEDDDQEPEVAELTQFVYVNSLDVEHTGRIPKDILGAGRKLAGVNLSPGMLTTNLMLKNGKTDEVFTSADELLLNHPERDSWKRSLTIIRGNSSSVVTLRGKKKGFRSTSDFLNTFIINGEVNFSRGVIHRVRAMTIVNWVAAAGVLGIVTWTSRKVSGAWFAVIVFLTPMAASVGAWIYSMVA